jgi:hypothetical protein
MDDKNAQLVLGEILTDRLTEIADSLTANKDPTSNVVDGLLAIATAIDNLADTIRHKLF